MIRSILRFLVMIAVGLAAYYAMSGLEISIGGAGKQGAAAVQSAPQDPEPDSSSAEVYGAEEKISTPAPLKVDSKWLKADAGLSILTPWGIMEETNKERAGNGLAPLSANPELNYSASAKAEDMARKGYFEHASPEGISIGDLAEEAGYEYLLIGENLAQGNFSGDQAVVSAWMASPGHRANILNSRYTEIGIGLAEAFIGGQKVWLAVQHFGRPKSLCPSIDEKLKASIESNRAKIETLERELNLGSGGAGAFLSYITDSEKIREYNKLIEDTMKDIDAYNSQVSAFNDCIQN